MIRIVTMQVDRVINIFVGRCVCVCVFIDLITSIYRYALYQSNANQIILFHAIYELIRFIT